jgi:hypothetical protein
MARGQGSASLPARASNADAAPPALEAGLRRRIRMDSEALQASIGRPVRRRIAFGPLLYQASRRLQLLYIGRTNCRSMRRPATKVLIAALAFFRDP